MIWKATKFTLPKANGHSVDCVQGRCNHCQGESFAIVLLPPFTEVILQCAKCASVDPTFSARVEIQ